ncbi:MAG: hypothetical protein N2690_04100 [Rhodocyclaceae bacterium]|nr:hypothetical protein [Rhodocyclaceae bacterium]
MGHVRLTYDGPALDAHTMDVRLLAPALLAFGDLCEHAAQALYGDAVRVHMEVKASFRTGSFGIDLSVSMPLAQQLIGLLSGDGATAIANATSILEAIGTAGGGLIAALRWLRGRRIKQVQTIQEGRRIITEDGDALVVEEAVIVLLQRRSVRESLQRVVEPIEREGIERLALGDDRQVRVVIERSEAAWLHVPPPEDVLVLDETRTIHFSVVSLSFREDNKWRLYDGQATVFVTMADQDFLERINRNQERFAKGDILAAQTRVTQRQTSEGLRTDYTIMRVLEHRMGAEQIHLPLE